MTASTIPPLSVWPCGTPFGNTQEGPDFGSFNWGSAMLTHVYVYDKDLPQSRIPSTPSLLPIRDLPAASITINYSFRDVQLFIRDKVLGPPSLSKCLALPLFRSAWPSLSFEVLGLPRFRSEAGSQTARGTELVLLLSAPCCLNGAHSAALPPTKRVTTRGGGPYCWGGGGGL